MGRTVNQSILAYWTDARVARYITPGRLCLDDNLYLNVEPSGSKQYFVRYRRDGKQHDLGLGSTRLITLHEAREAALNCRKLLAKGGDPIAHRREALAAQRVALAKRTLFGECVDRDAAAHQTEWNQAYAKRWRATIGMYAIPTLGALPVEAVDKQLVLKVLTPVWEQTPALGIKLRGGIEAVLDHATAHGLRGE